MTHNSDLEADTLYISNYLSALGRGRYLELLREAIEDGDDDSLAAPGIFDSHHHVLPFPFSTVSD